MTPEQITKWRTGIRSDAADCRRTNEQIDLATIDALLEIAFQLAELNERYRAHTVQDVGGGPP